jgi:hypothetical protein
MSIQKMSSALMEEDGYDDTEERRTTYAAESASAPTSDDRGHSKGRGALEKAAGIQAYRREHAIMTSKLIAALLSSCLLLGCTTGQNAVIAPPPPVMDRTNWIIASGPLTGASVSCETGYVPTCSYVDGAVKCVCVPMPYKEKTK